MSESDGPLTVGAPSTSIAAVMGADATPSLVCTAVRVIAAPLATAAVQPKSVSSDAGIVQKGVPPGVRGVIATLLPASLVPVSRTALVGENAGALKLKFAPGATVVRGAGVGVELSELGVSAELVVVWGAVAAAASGAIAAAPISTMDWIAKPVIASVTGRIRRHLVRRIAFARQRSFALRSRDERRGAFERDDCTVSQFSTASSPVSNICAW